ncbi:MAG: type I phosphomannose isomerase catalytic subunit [Bacteroidales bacterium]
MNKLYPLKFKPILKDKIWGGDKLNKLLGKKEASGSCGESWEISTVKDNLSVVSEGFLAGNNLEELIEIYMGDLVGDKIYEQFGLQFPLLIKYIDATADLSIQVHPDDETSRERHNSFGKTEMWYVIDAEPGSKLISGFKHELTQGEYVDALESGKIENILNYEEVKPGDVFFMPAGRVHAIGKGILLAEIQQMSDVTYRIYDWKRKDKDGKERELHTDLALDVIDFKKYDNYRTIYERSTNKSVNIGECKYFTTNLVNFDKTVEKDFNFIDSFVIYMCVNGKVDVLSPDNEGITISKGETIMIPAEIKNVILMPETPSSLLEIYVS